jgi:hypothetical protein
MRLSSVYLRAVSKIHVLSPCDPVSTTFHVAFPKRLSKNGVWLLSLDLNEAIGEAPFSAPFEELVAGLRGLCQITGLTAQSQIGGIVGSAPCHRRQMVQVSAPVELFRAETTPVSQKCPKPRKVARQVIDVCCRSFYPTLNSCPSV